MCTVDFTASAFLQGTWKHGSRAEQWMELPELLRKGTASTGFVINLLPAFCPLQLQQEDKGVFFNLKQFWECKACIKSALDFCIPTSKSTVSTFPGKKEKLNSRTMVFYPSATSLGPQQPTHLCPPSTDYQILFNISLLLWMIDWSI